LLEFVHLTDLHYASSAFQNELIKQLLKDLKSEKAKGANPAFVLISGDLVGNPEVPGIYPSFETNFLLPVLDALQISSSRVLLCPGNHDVNRAVQRENQLVYQSLQKSLGDQAFLTVEQSRSELGRYAKQISEAFFDVASRYGGMWESPFAKIHCFDAEKVAFIALNSAFGCSVEGSAKDRGQLALSSEAVLSAFQRIPDDYVKISFCHHSMGDLNESTVRELSSIIEKNALIHCFGHVHQAKPSTIVSVSGSCFYVQGGALYESTRCYNGYSLIRVAAARHVEAKYRSFYPDRREFDDGTNVSHGGRFYNSQSSESFWANTIQPPSEGTIRAFLLASRDSVVKQLETTMTERSLSETFVEPLLMRPKQGAEKAERSKAEPCDIKGLLASRSHIVIGSDNEFGSTSLLRYIVMQYHSLSLGLDRYMVPCIIDARLLRSYEASITGAIKSALPDTDDLALRLRSLHDSSRLAILIDDFDPANDNHVQNVRALTGFYPKARLIIIARLPLLSSDHLLPVVGVDDFIFVEMRPLTRGRVRELIKKWKEPSGFTIDQAVEEITSRFHALGIPLTAVYVVIYLSILEQDKGYSPINTSTVIENFIEGVLEKYKPEYRFRSAFDYRDQVAYLSFIAEKMCRLNEFEVEYFKMYDWTRSYFDYIGIEQDYQKVIEFFVLNKIFAQHANTVYFRYRIFLSFFIAEQLHISTDFRSFIFSPNTYMSYVNEIDIYCGLNRNDAATLEFLGNQFLSHDKKLAAMVAPLAWADRLDHLKLPSTEGDEHEFVDGISRQLTEPNLPEEARDAALDKQMQDQNLKPSITRPEVQGIVENWVLSLRAYTVALKNLEALPRDTKEHHLRVVLEGWATLLRYSCLLFHDLIDKRELSIGHFRFILSFPDSVKATILRRMFLNIPLIVSHFLRRDLGSQKLMVQLRNETGDSSATVTFLRTGLYADMKLNEFLIQLEKLRKRLEGLPFLQESLLVKLRDLYVRYSVGVSEERGFRQLVGTLSADLRGLKGRERSEHIQKYLEGLEKDAVVSKLRDAGS
jgi:hypothetical protein